MEKHKKIIIVFILIFVHVLLTQYVYFCPERSIIFGRGKTIAIAKTEVKPQNGTNMLSVSKGVYIE